MNDQKIKFMKQNNLVGSFLQNTTPGTQQSAQFTESNAHSLEE